MNNISDEICSTLDIKTRNFEYFSFAIDESVDIKDTVQLEIFISGINSEMNLADLFLNLVSFKNTTTGRDIQ